MKGSRHGGGTSHFGPQGVQKIGQTTCKKVLLLGTTTLL